MSYTPLISALVLTRYPDRPRMLEESLHSFAAQTYANKEAVIVNDGEPIACDAAWARVVNLAPDPRRTIGQKRNAALEAARGELVMTWDDDDLSLPGRMAEALSILHQRRAHHVRSTAMWIAGEDLLVRGRVPSPAFPTSLFRRDSALAVGGFGDYNYAEDRVLFNRLKAARHACETHDFRTYVHRRHASNVSRRLGGETLEFQLSFGTPCHASEIAEVNEAIARLLSRMGPPVVRPLACAGTPGS